MHDTTTPGAAGPDPHRVLAELRQMRQDLDDLAQDLAEVFDVIDGLRRAVALGGEEGADPTEQLVTLDQAAALCNRSCRTLEEHTRGMPPPARPRERGRASEWRWADLRPWLEARFGLALPAVFPPWWGDRSRRRRDG